MDHGSAEIDSNPAVQGELPPFAVLFPIQRVPDLMRRSPVPSLRQPEIRLRVTACLDERQILAIADQTRCQPIRLEKDAVTRRFIVIAESAAPVTDFHYAARTIEPREF